MTPAGSWLRRNAARATALALVATSYGFARLPRISDTDARALARRFRFARAELPPVDAGDPLLGRRVRPVHPRLQHISGWISSVGAAVALADLDGDGLPNDACYVDTRTDQVVVSPVPEARALPGAYAAFALDAAPLPYDRDRTAPMGCLPGDLDEDGRTDLLVYYWGRPPIAFLNRLQAVDAAPMAESVPGTRPAPSAAQPPTGAQARLVAAAYRAVELVPGGERWYTNCATRADLDGDGHLDLVIGNYFADGARILDAQAGSDGASPEMQDSMSRALNGGRNRLLLCAPVEQSGERTVRCGEAQGALDHEVAQGWTLAVGAADLDGDQRPEIYFANDFGPDRLLHNRSRPGAPRFARLKGVKEFTTPNSKVLGNDSFKGMGVDFADASGDGLLDIYVSNIADTYALEESHFLFVATGERGAFADGVAPYLDRSEPLGLARSRWAWDARLADFDNDGAVEALQATGFLKGEVNRWPELHELAMGNDTLLRRPGAWHRFQPGDDLSGGPGLAFFSRDRRGIFFDLTAEVGLLASEVGRGIASADVDGDGDLDFAVGNQWAPAVYYRNESAGAGRFLGLRLLLPAGRAQATTRVYPGRPRLDAPARPAVGAAAVVTLPAHGLGVEFLPGLRRLVGQVDGGNGHSGKRSPELHFGLGALGPDERVQVDLHWRDGAGHVRRASYRLRPGWHTLLLASGSREKG